MDISQVLETIKDILPYIISISVLIETIMTFWGTFKYKTHHTKLYIHLYDCLSYGGINAFEEKSLDNHFNYDDNV